MFRTILLMLFIVLSIATIIVLYCCIKMATKTDESIEYYEQYKSKKTNY